MTGTLFSDGAGRNCRPVSADGAFPETAWWTAVASLPDVGPARFAALRECWSGEQAWHRLLAGTPHREPLVAQRMGPGAEPLAAAWSTAARQVSVGALWDQHLRCGVTVTLPGDPSYPVGFIDDPDPPGIVFSRGVLDRLDGPRVGVVGTRRASRYGHDVAYELGFGLARAGVRVVSGLALGIDGAAHRGALDAAHGAEGAPPIGVVASGLDVCYPPRHADLWEQVATHGVLLSEAPLGVRPQRWRFPARNRLISALSDALVVVESPARGGALLTADETLDRGGALFAVPGSVQARSAEGTNALLAEGAGVCRGVDDLLVELGLQPGGRRGRDQRRDPGPGGRAVLDALGWQPATLDQLAGRTGLALAELATFVGSLEEAGWLAVESGWLEQIAPKVSR